MYFWLIIIHLHIKFIHIFLVFFILKKNFLFAKIFLIRVFCRLDDCFIIPLLFHHVVSKSKPGKFLSCFYILLKKTNLATTADTGTQSHNYGPQTLELGRILFYDIAINFFHFSQRNQAKETLPWKPFPLSPSFQIKSAPNNYAPNILISINVYGFICFFYHDFSF